MADLLPEKWMKAMAVTTTALGVVASIASSRASFYITKSQLMIAQEADQWAYYDAKSIKQDLFQTKIQGLEFKKLGAVTSAQTALYNRNIDDYQQSITRYVAEKLTINQQAEKIRTQNKIFTRRASQFSLSIIFAQIAILLSSVGVLLKQRRLWLIGLIFGIISLVFIANGFLLFLRI